MTLISLKQAAGQMGIHYETFRRKREKGVFRRIEFVKYGDHAREMVVLESVLVEIKAATKKGARGES